MPIRALLPLLVAVVAWVPCRAEAQLSLRWQAPEACPEEPAVRAEVLRLLGGQLPDDLELSADAVARRLGDRWHLRLDTRSSDGAGRRELEGDSCEQLANAAALILALMIDPTSPALVETAEPAPGPAPGSTAEPEPPEGEAPREVPIGTHLAQLLRPPPPTPPRQPPTASGSGGRVERDATPEDAPPAPHPPEIAPPGAGERWTGRIGIGAALDVGSVPEVSGGLVVVGAVGVPLIEARLRATFIFSQTAARGADSGAAVTATMLDAAACLHPFEQARFLYGCLGLGLGVVIAEGFGISAPELGVGTFAAGLAGVGIAWSPVGWLDLELDAGLIVPFNPLAVAVRAAPDDVFYQQEPVAGRFAITAHVRF